MPSTVEKPSMNRLTLTMATFYVLSGVCQPLIMTLCKGAGLADPTAQLYMLFYYFGPGCLIFTIWRDKDLAWPVSVIGYACLIALFDLSAQAMNYTGASLAGPTIFSVVYSSVTVWTALLSRIFLGRSMTWIQWFSVFVVFAGLAITANDSAQLGTGVVTGTVLVLVGSSMHGSTYVMSEAIMTVTTERLSPRQNAAIQGAFAALCLFFWQWAYTASRFQELIGQPMREAGTSVWQAAGILFSFGLANTVHSWSFSFTLKHFNHGATSAGVMKGLQAVLVFLVAHVAYCGWIGGEEMCFTWSKFCSLVTVGVGVTVFGVEQQRAVNSTLNGYEIVGEGEATQVSSVTENRLEKGNSLMSPPVHR